MTLKGTFNAPQPTPGRSWDAHTPCKPSCCKTPYGHSTVRDNALVASLRCHCHGEEPKS